MQEKNCISNLQSFSSFRNEKFPKRTFVLLPCFETQEVMQEAALQESVYGFVELETSLRIESVESW
jgi:hypothetical protein